MGTVVAQQPTRDASPSSVDDEKRAYETREVVDYKAQFPNIDEGKLLRKIDFRLVPVLCILYLLAFLDRCVSFSTRPPPALTSMLAA